MSTKLQMSRDINGYVAYGLNASFDLYGGYLTTNVEQHFIIPNNYQVWQANFSIMPGSSVWVAFNQTAIIPTSTFGGVNCELNPSSRIVRAGDLISMLTSDQTNDWIGVSLYALQ